jgi:endonuclease/exonuclease/phosphatase family metal-dependent hydrolase
MTEPAADFGLTVLTVNTHKGYTFFNRKFILHELREAVRAVGADVVFLQEVMGSAQTGAAHGAHRQRLPAALQQDASPTSHYEFLADTIWPEYAYGRNAVYPKGHHGNALLSKFPITHYENRDISVNGPEKRGLLHCVLHVPERAVDVHAVCVHLGLRESHRQLQLAQICDLLDNEIPAGAPVIVAGDFNDWRRRADHVLERCAGLHEVFVRAHGSAARTFPARWPVLRLDRIYVRNATVHSPMLLPRRPWSHLSDHAPLAAEIRI